MELAKIYEEVKFYFNTREVSELKPSGFVVKLSKKCLLEFTYLNNTLEVKKLFFLGYEQEKRLLRAELKEINLDDFMVIIKNHKIVGGSYK